MKQVKSKKTIKTIKSISIILPLFNEEENVKLQYEKIKTCVHTLGTPYEIIFVDDGSTDKSLEILKKLAQKDKTLKIIEFRRNFGQTAAMAAGIDFASGEVIIFMDSDLQNDPVDIVNLLDKIEEGYDVVSGWRVHRQDKLFSRKIPSWIANRLIAKVSGVPLHDLGCSLKAFRSDVLKKVKLYGEMHRFIPVHASWIGAKITEIPVNHHARQFGNSKYGLIRTFKVMLDLITIKFLGSFSTKPIYLYGGLGIFLLGMSTITFTIVILMKIFLNHTMTRNPLTLLTVTLVLLSSILILMGIQAEILIRIYHSSTEAKSYYVKSTTNIKEKNNEK